MVPFTIVEYNNYSCVQTNTFVCWQGPSKIDLTQILRRRAKALLLVYLCTGTWTRDPRHRGRCGDHAQDRPHTSRTAGWNGRHSRQHWQDRKGHWLVGWRTGSYVLHVRVAHVAGHR